MAGANFSKAFLFSIAFNLRESQNPRVLSQTIHNVSATLISMMEVNASSTARLVVIRISPLFGTLE
jgi:hypothetical protein